MRAAVVYEVYGLPFCEVHGMEANVGAMAQLHNEATDEFDRMDNAHATPIQPEVLRVARVERERNLEDHHRYHCRHDALLLDAYPLIPERIDPETRGWRPGDVGFSPVDWWAEEYRQLCSFMLQTCRSWITGLVRELEPLRERAAAQYAFAMVVDEDKIEAYKAARAEGGT